MNEFLGGGTGIGMQKNIFNLMIISSISIFLISSAKITLSEPMINDECWNCHENIKDQFYSGNLHTTFSCRDCHIVMINETYHEPSILVSCKSCHQNVVVEELHFNMDKDKCITCHSKYVQSPYATPIMELKIDLMTKRVEFN